VVQIGGDSLRTTRSRSKLTNLVSTSVSGRRFMTMLSLRCSQSVQRRNASASLAKRHRVVVCGSGPSLFFLSNETSIQGSQLAQPDGDLLGFGRVEQLWMRLELSLLVTSLSGCKPRGGGLLFYSK